jgi:hypothetical protein
MKIGDLFHSWGERFLLPLAANVLLLVSCACTVQAEESFYPITTSDKAFFEQIRNSILTDDIDWLAKSVAYPIVLRPAGNEIAVRNKHDLKKRSKLILNEHLKSVVRTQSPDTLFKNWQGVMIGDGEIWYSKIIEKGREKRGWVLRVIAIN